MNLLKTDGINMTYFRYTKRTGDFKMFEGGRAFPCLDLTFCIEGEMHYVYNGEHIILRAGDGIMILPGTARERYESFTPTRYASINVTFDYQEEFEIDGYLPGVVNSSILYMLDILKKDYVTVSLNRNQKCLSAFSYIYNQIVETVCDREKPHIKAVKQFISDNLSGDLSLSRIAEHVHLAPQYICSLFKKETGMTITQFTLKSRIDNAKMLILSTNEPVSKIAESCGFSDYCYFSHAFKKITGISARQFRSEYLK